MRAATSRATRSALLIRRRPSRVKISAIDAPRIYGMSRIDVIGDTRTGRRRSERAYRLARHERIATAGALPDRRRRVTGAARAQHDYAVKVSGECCDYRARRLQSQELSTIRRRTAR